MDNTKRFREMLIWVWNIPFKIILFPMVILGVWIEMKDKSSLWDVWREAIKLHWED